jgi:hypothetical protein
VTLNREQILAVRAALPREAVDVPELGGTVYVRALTLKEVGDIQTAQKTLTDPLLMHPKLVILAIVDEAGAPLFGPADADAVASLPWPALKLMVDAIMRINRMGPDDPKDRP